MNKKVFKLMLLAAVFITVSASGSAQIFVKSRPAVPVKVKPAQPHPGYVWVNEDWEPNGGTYRYSGGRWVAPPQAGYAHRNGYWQSTSQGMRWVKGKWYKKQPANKGNHYGQYKGNQKGKPKVKGKH